MLVTLASKFLCDFFPIPTLYCEIPDLYTKIPTFYADNYIFGFHCAGNKCGRVLVGYLNSLANDDARAMHG